MNKLIKELKGKIPEEAFDSLILADIKCLSSILNMRKTDLSQITKLNLNTVETIFKVSANIFFQNKFYTANQLPVWYTISTGCTAIDEITRGGIPTNGITEIVGCSGVGKTQLCLQLSLIAQINNEQNGAVVYICTEDVFPAKRLNELALHFRKSNNIDFENNIFIEHAADFEQLRRCIFDRLGYLLKAKKVRLIVIDSIAGIFRSENVDVNYTNRTQEFILLVSKLNQYLTKYNFATVCVNQVTDNIQTNKTEPCLGLAWSNLVTRRFCINRYLHSAIREFQIIFAPDLPNQTCKFKITQEGLINAEI